MNHVIGSAIRLLLEVDEYLNSNADVTITDPDGVVIVLNSPMSYTTSPAERFEYVWQSLINNALGQYKVLFRVVNGIYTVKSLHTFYLEDDE